ncbi:DUF1080 domain-containing protein [Haloferula sp. A504]|uniref:DUF1080 domain-containing protein n=1 Tax=Haloferula sp. A504 TaxID=3373601 RepID=UPI0031CACCE3|nr:DUF1080 domain-containing protein [Verrucomicrobiaceae bacterium E54]
MNSRVEWVIWPGRNSFPGLVVLAITLGLLAGPSLADQAGERIALFNGKDLTGWEGAPGWWTVEDGALTSESTVEKPCKKANYLVWTGGQPADFQLDLDFKLSGQGNSGIQIRSERRPNFDMFGYQADMTGEGKLIGYIYHHKHGLVAERGQRVTLDAGGERHVEALDKPAHLLRHYKAGEWNHYRILCRGGEITVWLNGVEMCHIADQGSATAAKSGWIGLQMHPGPPMKVQFKNLHLTSLNATPAP